MASALVRVHTGEAGEADNDKWVAIINMKGP